MAYVKEIKDMYEIAKVRMVGGDLEYFHMEMGYTRGRLLARFFFSLVMDVLTRYIQDEVPMT